MHPSSVWLGLGLNPPTHGILLPTLAHLAPFPDLHPQSRTILSLAMNPHISVSEYPPTSTQDEGHPSYHSDDMSTSSSNSSVSDQDMKSDPTLQRPRLGSRKSSGTIIIPRDSPNVEMKEEEEEYDDGDARTMSPRRSSEEIEKMGQDARQALIE